MLNYYAEKILTDGLIEVEIFPEDYYDCLNMNREEIAGGSDTETDSVSDDDNI